MIQIPRSVARTVRAVFRKLVKKPAGTGRPAVSFRADRTGLRVRLHNTEVLAEFQQAGSYSPETTCVPFDALADFDGKGNGIVTLENAGAGTVQARWDDGGVPQVKDYDAPDLEGLPKFPAPTNLTPADQDLVKALADAAETAAREAVRYAISHVQIRGRAGEIVATDGKQLLVQSGFRFPFVDDVLIPSTTVLACKELSGGEVAIGAEKEFVNIQVGAWTFYFKADKQGRFPRTEHVIPASSAVVTRCHISPEDATFLAKSLQRLPGVDVDSSPVTVDLNGKAAIRARASAQAKPTEIVLTKSEVTGKAVRACMNREMLARALALGFTEFGIVNADKPIIAQDARRKYVFMPLEKKAAIPPSEDCLRITPQEAEQPAPKAVPGRKREFLPATEPAVSESNGSTNGNGKVHAQEEQVDQPVKGRDGASDDLVGQVSELKNVLRDAFTRAHHLMTALQRHKKQSRIVRTTLASLRQLQHLDVE